MADHKKTARPCGHSLNTSPVSDFSRLDNASKAGFLRCGALVEKAATSCSNLHQSGGRRRPRKIQYHADSPFNVYSPLETSMPGSRKVTLVHAQACIERAGARPAAARARAKDAELAAQQ